MNLFEFARFREIDGRARIDRRATQASTVEFLLANSNVRLDRNAFADAKHLLTLANESRAWARLLNVALGSFVRPARIFAVMVALIVGFGAAYARSGSDFNIIKPETNSLAVRPLDKWEAMYFSGITFTTTGYGDITPRGKWRFVAVSEAMLGVTLVGAFLIAMTRKYVD